MIFEILGAPITAPVAGFKFILQQLRDMAEKELYDPDRIREELLLLQMRLEEGEITEEEYKQMEEPIMVRWRAAHDYLNQQGSR